MDVKGDLMMAKEKALEILMLLSALESWAFSLDKPLPHFLDAQLVSVIKDLKNLVLEKSNLREV